MAVYSIWEGKIEEVRKNAEKIIKKCEQYGCSFTFTEVGEEFRDIYGETYRYIQVDIEGVARCGDWEVVASIEHLEGGNFILSFNHEDVPSEYINAKPVCEHCNTLRNRKFTYLVKNLENGQFRQVGSACLNDYTGISLETATHIRRFFSSAIAEDYDLENSQYRGLYRHTLGHLAQAVKVVNEVGYVKSTDGYEGHPSTASRVKDLGTLKEDSKTSASYREAEAILSWAKNLECDNSQYLGNLRTLASQEFIEARHLGYLVSMVPAYRRAMREAENASPSVWVGTVGRKHYAKVTKALLMASWETQYGVTHLYQFSDESGNVIIWKTAKNLELDSVKTISGSVKAHSVFRGIQQTELTRCAVG